MERTHIAIIGAAAVLGLFGLKVWSDRTADSGLDAESRGADQRLARVGNLHGESGGGSDWGGSRQAGSEPGSLRYGTGMHAAGGASGSSGGVSGHGASGGGGSAEAMRAAGARLPSGVTSAGSAANERSGGAWGSASSGGGGSLPVGQNAARGGSAAVQKQNLVDFLSSQAPTHQDLAAAKPEGEDVALKLDKVSDIASQGGEAQGVKQDDNGITMDNTGVMQFPNNVSPDAATISFTFTPNWAGSDPTDNALLELRGDHDWSNRIELVKNGEFLRFIVTPSGGQEADISVRINDWQAGVPHDIQASYGPDGTVLNVDGVQRGQNTLTSPLQFSQNTPLFIGSDHVGSNYNSANGTFNKLSISNSK